MALQETSYSIRIGNTTFAIHIKQAENAKKPIESAFRELCFHEAMEDWIVTKKETLEKLTKSS